MCFSAEADLVAGVVVTAIGIDAIQRVRTRKELPLAALPLLLGIHMLIEAFVWWGLEGKVPAAVGTTATWAYLVLAFILPLWVPLAVRGVEPERGRRRLMAALAALGFVVSVILVLAVIAGPIDTVVVGHHVEYTLDIWGGVWVAALYAVAACGALLLASNQWIRLFGLVNLAAVVLLVWLQVGGLTSLWCVWAGITSIVIDRYLRDVEPPRDVVIA
jgi:hypothetical protein